jgi:hypothetical protein
MFGAGGAHDLGYANAAFLIALTKTLIANGTITKNQSAELLDDALGILEPLSHISSINGAMRMINTEFKARIGA